MKALPFNVPYNKILSRYYKNSLLRGRASLATEADFVDGEIAYD